MQANTPVAATECVQDSGEARAATPTPATPATARIGATSPENGALPSGFPILWQNGGIPTLEAVIAQIPDGTRDLDRLAAHIRAKYRQDKAAISRFHDAQAAHELALLYACQRADSLHGFSGWQHFVRIGNAILQREALRATAPPVLKLSPLIQSNRT